MDIEHSWSLSDDIDSLIDVVFNCKKDLVKMCFVKFGAAKISEFGVYASEKVCKLILAYKTAQKPHDDIVSTPYSTCVGNFENFNLFNCKIIDDKNIRIMIKFDTGEGTLKSWYANIKVDDNDV